MHKTAENKLKSLRLECCCQDLVQLLPYTVTKTEKTGPAHIQVLLVIFTQNRKRSGNSTTGKLV